MRGQNQIAFASLYGKVAHSSGGEVAAFVLRPMLPGIDGDPEAELGADKKQIRIDRIFFDDVSVAAHSAFLQGKIGPGFAVIGGLVSVRRHVAESVAVETFTSRGFVRAGGFDRREPGGFSQGLGGADYTR